MLSVSGLGYDYKPKLLRYLNHIMITVHAVNFIAVIVNDTLDLPRLPLYIFIGRLVYVIFSLVSLKSIRSSWSSLFRSLQLGDECLSAHQKAKLKNRSYILVFTTVADLLIRTLSSLVPILLFGDKLPLSKALCDSTRFRILDLFNVAALHMYVYFILTYTEILAAHIRSLSLTNVSLRQLETRLHEIKMLLNGFNDKFANIPLSWFTHNFTFWLSNLVAIEKSEVRMRNSGFREHIIYLMAFSLVAVLSMALTVGNINQYLQREYWQQYEAILRRAGLSARARYVESRKNDYRIELTVYGLFELDRKCILSYLSALVTFTILFMQLNKVL
ncbi:hypothetical protein HDE_06763 [Halotydeus destructor]|nr:hypothetical protein HDE_06763 [Halotydeus destructor]